MASGHDGGLDFAAAVHQLLKDAVEFVEVSVASDECAGLESAAGNEVESLAADGWGVVKGGAQGDVAVVDAIGVERDVGADGASAEEVDRAAFAHHSTASSHASGTPTASMAMSTPRFFGVSARVSRMALRMLLVCTT